MVQERLAVNMVGTGLICSGACSCEYGVDWIRVTQQRVAVSMVENDVIP
jgi:hypothetical protein